MQLFVLEMVIWLVIRSHRCYQLMMQKIVSELIVHTHANQVLKEQKGEEPTKSTGGVSAKDPLKVKSMIK